MTTTVIDEAPPVEAAHGFIRSATEIAPFELSEDEEAVVIKAQLLKVNDEASFVDGGTLLVGVKRLARRVAAHYKTYRDPLNVLRKTILDMEKADADPLDAAIEKLEPQVVAFDRAQKAAIERERQRRQAEADEDARQKQQAQADAVKRVAEAEPDKRISRALHQEAKAIERMPVAAAQVAAPAPIKVAGLSIAKTYKADVVDVLAICRAVVAGRLPVSVLEPERLRESHQALDKMAQTSGPTLSLLCPDGVRVVEASSTTGR